MYVLLKNESAKVVKGFEADQKNKAPRTGLYRKVEQIIRSVVGHHHIIDQVSAVHRFQVVGLAYPPRVLLHGTYFP
jgi:hypothetical protein